MDIFYKFIDYIINVNEGGYSNKNSDSGKETIYGITIATARKYAYNGAMRDLPRNTAISIYKEAYWHKSGADKVAKISYDIAFLLLDFSINTGVNNAVRKLQVAINSIIKNIDNRKNNLLKIDGIIGKKTLAEIDYLTSGLSGYKVDFLLCYIYEILKYYTSLKNPNTGFAKNGAGWVNRVANNIKILVGGL